MNRKIIIRGKAFNYKIKKSFRAKRVRISVSCDAGVVLTLPHLTDEKMAEKFLLQKIDWIADKVRHFKNFKKIKSSRKDYLENKEPARRIIEEKISFLNRSYNFRFNKISIKNQKTRWGSCSKDGNLNFNYKIIHLPEELRNYIIVHELCHLGELNHSKRFWNLVGETFPDHKRLRKELRKIIL